MLTELAILLIMLIMVMMIMKISSQETLRLLNATQEVTISLLSRPFLSGFQEGEKILATVFRAINCSLT